MEGFATSIPQTIVGWFSLLLFFLTGVIYLLSRIRKDDLDTLRASNKDLRDSITDLQNKQTELEVKVVELEGKNGTLYEIISSALDKYFSENPTIVKEYQKMIKEMYKHNEQLVYGKRKRA